MKQSGGRGQTEASSLDRMVISARTNLALRRSFAVRRAKQLPLFGRLCLFVDISFDHPMVSRRHAAVRFDPNSRSGPSPSQQPRASPE